MLIYQMIPMPEYTLVLDEPVNPVEEYLGQRRLTLLSTDSSNSVLPAEAVPRFFPKKAPRKALPPPVLNVNQANEDQLDLLPGIGPVLARRIVEYRAAHGAYQSIEQILEVKGIGPKNFEKMKPYLRI